VFAVAGNPAASVPLAGLAAEERLLARTVFTAPGPTFPFGAHVAVVEVDTETGKAVLLRVVTVDDAGTVINPLLAEGQRHGGIAQGAAQAFLEEVVYDSDGNPLTASLADYPFVSATEVPSFELADMQTPTSYNPLGAKGIGARVAGVAGSRWFGGVFPRDWHRAIGRIGERVMRVELAVNGLQRSRDVEPRLLLVHYLREVCGLRSGRACRATSAAALATTTSSARSSRQPKP